MTRNCRIMFVGALALSLGALSSVGHAQSLSFSKEQVGEGRKAYRTACAVCHGARMEGIHLSPSLVGERFDMMWRGKSADLLSFHVRRMPPEIMENRPNLSEEDYTNIVAYILMSNEFEVGESALPSDMKALGRLKIPRKPGAQIDPDAPVELSEEQQQLIDNLSPVTDAMLENPSPNDWVTWGRDFKGLSYSPLDQINKETIGNLSLAWRAPLRPGMTMATPVVHGGVMYVHTFPDTVLAMDASNGQVLWRYQYKGASRSSSKLGVSLHDDMVFVPTSNQHVQALNAKTGELIWDHEIDMRSTGTGLGGYNLRTSPVVIGDKVIQGITASFMPKGGFLLALDIETGEEAWRFNTIARPGTHGGNTWNDVPMEKRSGGSIWHHGTYDPELNLLYFGAAPTYDTGPLLHSVNKPGVSSDALYTNCTLALNPDTGELVWHYQHLSNDQWDLDWAFERQIVEVPVNGKMRKAVMNIGKIAILEALDAETGEYLFSVDTGVQNFITAIDPKTGEKTIDPAKLPSIERPCTVCPSAIGARSWPPTAYSPRTKFSYVPITDSCMILGPGGMQLLTSGVGITPTNHPLNDDGMLGRLQAIDVANQKLAWAHNQLSPISTGALTTGGELVFTGDLDPSLKAFDDATGELLWKAQLDDAPTSGLITFSANGVQYVAVVVGMSNLHVGGLQGQFQGFAAQNKITRESVPKGGASIWAFALP